MPSLATPAPSWRWIANITTTDCSRVRSGGEVFGSEGPQHPVGRTHPAHRRPGSKGLPLPATAFGGVWDAENEREIGATDQPGGVGLPMRAGTIFRLSSLTKPIVSATSLAIAMLRRWICSNGR